MTNQARRRSWSTSDPDAERSPSTRAGTTRVPSSTRASQVRCWGYNDAGQLGQDDTVTIGNDPGESTVVVDLPGKAVAISAGGSNSCAILEGGQLRCWGSNAEGQLMQSNTENAGDGSGETTVTVGSGPARAVSVGARHMCAVDVNGRLRCWGSSSHGQLGMGRTTPFGDGPGEDSVGPVTLPAGRTVTAVSAGTYHSCAILDTGQLRCWGRNVSGTLGQGNTTDHGDDPGETTLSVNLGASARSVGTGYDYTCAVAGSGLRCWGENEEGQLARGGTTDFGTQTGEVPALLPPVSLGGQQVGRDRDGDGVRDAVDACPAAAGPPAVNGCPPPPQAVLKGKKVVIDTVLAKKKASAKCPAKATVTVKTRTKKGPLKVVKQLKTTNAGTGCTVKGKVGLGAKPKKPATTKVTITGTKLKTKRLVAVRA